MCRWDFSHGTVMDTYVLIIVIRVRTVAQYKDLGPNLQHSCEKGRCGHIPARKPSTAGNRYRRLLRLPGSPAWLEVQ